MIEDFGSFTLSGASVINPTSLQIGPDGRLYVSEQAGGLKIFSVAETPGGFEVTGTEAIDLIKNIPNHNDDGTLNLDVLGRQITGLLVTEDALGQPVIYVGSSDPRIGAGPGGQDLSIDTNSGVITRLTPDGQGGWTAVDLVRGLPRSEENHSVNGLEIDPATGKLYVAVGGFTNAGAPSNNFANTPEYALSAGILTIDLPAIDALPVQTDPQSGRQYIYDLPTLDDPTRPNNAVTGLEAAADGSPDVWGGNNGLNQAKWVTDGPVQVYASGFRNPYDLVFHSNGFLYSVDNGANIDWGGRPLTPDGVPVTDPGQIATETPSNDTAGNPDGDFDTNNLDNLHVITGPGQYFGHPNPIRAWGEEAVYDPSDPGKVPYNPKWPLVPADIATVTPDLNGAAPGHDPQQGVFIQPGQGDGALYLWKTSTNGIVEYGSTVDPTLTGALITASLSGALTVLPVAPDGLSVGPASKINIGGIPLDIWAQDDGEPFAGTIWIADYSNQIRVLAKDKDPVGGDDEDDDNDGLLDTVDRMPVDPHNGTKTLVGAGETLTFDFNGTLPSQVPFEDFYKDAGFNGFGVSAGFSGIMKSDGDIATALYNPENIIPQGAANVFQIDEVGVGDAVTNKNSQENAFFFGATAAPGVGKIIYTTVIDNPLDTINDSFQSQGIFIGTGDEDNYLKITAAINGFNQPIIQVAHEVGGVLTAQGYALSLPPGLIQSSDLMSLQLVVDTATGTVLPAWAYTTGNQTGTTVIASGTPVQLQGAALAAAQGTYTVTSNGTTLLSSLGYGIISTANGATSSFAALWEKLTLEGVPAEPSPPPTLIGSAKVTANPGSPSIDASTFNTAAMQITNTGLHYIARVEIDLSTAAIPDLVFDPLDGTPAGDTTGQGLVVDDPGGSGVILPADPNTTPFANPHKNGYRTLAMDFEHGQFTPGEAVSFSVDIDPTSIAGQVGAGSAGSVSGLELTGATVRVTYMDGTVQTGQFFGDESLGGGEAYMTPGLAQALTLSLGGLGNGAEGILASPAQTLALSGGQPFANVRVMVVKGGLDALGPTPPLSPTDPVFDLNSANTVTYFTTKLDGNGAGAVDISTALVADTDERFQVSAVITHDIDATAPGSEAAGLVSAPITVKIDSTATPPSLADGDDDGDGIVNKQDPFVKDAANGATTTIGYGLEFAGADPNPELFGFSGLMTNGVDPHTVLFNQPIAGPGSSRGEVSVNQGFITIQNVSDGDAFGVNNDQANAFQFGLATAGQAVTLETAFLNPFKAGGSNFQSLGLQIGPGDQNNYLKFVFGTNGANQFQFLNENNGQPVGQVAKLPAGLAMASIDYVKLFIDIDPAGGEPVATARYELYAGAPPGAMTLLGSGFGGTFSLDGTVESAFEGTHAVGGVPTQLAVGLITTSTTGGVNGTDQPFTAQWDYLRTHAPSTDTGPPGSALQGVADITTAMTAPQILTVIHADPSGIEPTRLDAGDLVINGPTGVLAVDYLGQSRNLDGSVTATYQLQPPGGSWDAADNGTYIVLRQAGQVFDQADNAGTTAIELGGFDVLIPAVDPLIA